MPAIRLGPGANISLKNVAISGFDVGVEGAVGSSVSGNNVTFHNVAQPWNMPNAGPSKLRGTRIHDDPKLRRGIKRATPGRRRPIGSPLPLFCPSCKQITASQNYVFGGVFWELWDNEEECPACHNPGAKLAEGIFDLAKEVAQIISAPDVTHAMLQAIADVSARVRSGELGPEEAIADVERTSPALSKIWKRALAVGGFLFTAIVGLSNVGSYYLAQSSKTDDILNAIESSQRRSDKVLEKLLEGLPYGGAQGVGSKKASVKNRAQQHSHGPAKRQTPTETGSIELKSERKPKARELRRKAQQERRRMFSRPGHAAPSGAD